MTNAHTAGAGVLIARSCAQGVEIGPLLGKGSGGRVYRGRWNAIPVAGMSRSLATCA
jgi:hypothetical protein